VPVQPFEGRPGNHVPAPDHLYAAGLREVSERAVADRIRDAVADEVNANGFLRRPEQSERLRSRVPARMSRRARWESSRALLQSAAPPRAIALARDQPLSVRASHHALPETSACAPAITASKLVEKLLPDL
jgi:hypothetical protein